VTERFHRVSDDVDPAGQKSDDQTVTETRAGTVHPDLAHVQTSERECDHGVAENEHPEMSVHIVLRPPMRRGRHVGALHEYAVPDEAEEKDEDERSQKRDETSFVILIHELLLIPLVRFCRRKFARYLGGCAECHCRSSRG
jgi:hypothetical protein